MKSRVSWFNSGLSKNILKRSWPLWSAYLLTVLCALPLFLMRENAMKGSDFYGIEQWKWLLDYSVYDSATAMPYISFVYAIVAAMVLFGFLYNSRSCGMMASLPIKRETMFVTVYLTGALAFAAADVIAALAALLGFAGSEYFHAASVFTWLAAALMSNLSFYGFAVFCAMLTGSLYVLPAVYVVLNLTAWVAEQAVQAILSETVYGFVVSYEQSMLFIKFAPLPGLMSEFNCRTVAVPTEYGVNELSYVLNGMGLLGIYCAVGVLLSVWALFMFRNRRMETADDTVAIPILKPMFKYCLCIGTALVAGALGYKLLFENLFSGISVALVIFVIMLIGAFIGYFTAEMLIQKTVFVFRRGWKGLMICAAALLVFMAAAEFDVFGYEKRIPKAEDVEFINLSGSFGWQTPDFREEENIERVIAFHRWCIDEKDAIESSDCTAVLDAVYYLKDGSTLERLYRYPGDYELAAELGCLETIPALLNSSEAVLHRVPQLQELETAENTYCQLYYTTRELSYLTRYLTDEETLELYACVIRDRDEGTLGLIHPFSSTPQLDEIESCVSLEIVLSRTEYKYIEIPMTAANTAAWLEAHGIELISVKELDELQQLQNERYGLNAVG